MPSFFLPLCVQGRRGRISVSVEPGEAWRLQDLWLITGIADHWDRKQVGQKCNPGLPPRILSAALSINAQDRSSAPWPPLPREGFAHPGKQRCYIGAPGVPFLGVGSIGEGEPEADTPPALGEAAVRTLSL